MGVLLEANLRKVRFLLLSTGLYLACFLLYGVPSSIKLLEQGMAAFEVGLYGIAAKNFSEISYNYPSDPTVVTASFLEALSLYMQKMQQLLMALEIIFNVIQILLTGINYGTG